LPLGIDHAVIAVRDLDAAAATFSRLGFSLTPRGFHSIGSENHCIMFASTYIELLAAPRPHPWLEYYRDFLRRGEGLAAVALATSDADASYRELVAKGIAARPPMDLARPVKLGGREETARFRIVQLENKSLFVCQHLTRELSFVALAPDQPFEGLPASS
jgi:hypothetical protein